MQDWSQFQEIEEYYNWLDKAEETRPFSYKIGVFDKHRFHHKDLGNFLEHFLPDPPANKTEPAKETVLGLITHHSLSLKTESLLSDPKDFSRQGDIFNAQFDSLAGGPTAVGMASYRILVSHTCTAFNDFVCTICPGYTAEEFQSHVGKLKKDGQPTYLATAGENKVARFLAFTADQAWSSARLIFDLGQLYTISTELLEKTKPVRSLTFPGNVYFSARLSMLLHRDVEKRDDRREV